VVAAKGGVAIDKPEDLAGEKVRRLALAEPKTVPAGIYAREYLEKRDLWRSVASKVVPTENVRGALAAVEAGNAEAGIVYKTDAKISRQVKVAYEIPTADAPEISYPMAVLRGSKAPEAARRFHEYLGSEEAGKIFKKYGFETRD
jgi:molybdate transport system substrate-binding protein